MVEYSILLWMYIMKDPLLSFLISFLFPVYLFLDGQAYTVDAAFSSFDETSKGMLKVGYLADIVLIDRNLFDIPPHSIWDAKIRATIVGGKVVYTNDQDGSNIKEAILV